jgi:hypothetical protein
MKARPETIVLIGFPERKEDKAVAAFSPGHILEFSGAGVRKQSTAKIAGRKAVAFENELLGKTIQDAYDVNENAYYGIFKSGEKALVRVAAAAAAIAKGDRLEFDGTGCLRKWTDGIAQGIADEALDNSAGATEAFLKVEWL